MTDTSLRINLDIMDFVEKQILPRYVNFDRAHNLSHVTSVMKRSIDLASKIGADKISDSNEETVDFPEPIPPVIPITVAIFKASLYNLNSLFCLWLLVYKY